MAESLIGGRYRLTRKIGSGSFGDIYLGTDIASSVEVAIKMERAKSRHPQLLYESKVYKLLRGGEGIPCVHWYGTESVFHVMVMDLLGPSLEDLFTYCSRRFSLKTVLSIGSQLMRRIEYVHSMNFIHRDIKPDNFLIGLRKKASMLYIIDFGLAKRYRDPKTHQHIPYRENKALTGTARYASINTHIGIEQSRRDDLESIGYVLMYFLRGSLPWQGLKARNRTQKYQKIMEKKMTTPLDTLCEGFPSAFVSYFEYLRMLRFEDKPDYLYLRGILRDLYCDEGFADDSVFDWNIVQAKKDKAKRAAAAEAAAAGGGEGAAGADGAAEDGKAADPADAADDAAGGGGGGGGGGVAPAEGRDGREAEKAKAEAEAAPAPTRRRMPSLLRRARRRK
eukprot:PLAT10803.2.p1 GENE.PLAT10803.2~~PLAT10803.2.p1  ORF type:complete len:393 (-),score=207.48 PLAT10803.2:122-1300(-)